MLSVRLQGTARATTATGPSACGAVGVAAAVVLAAVLAVAAARPGADGSRTDPAVIAPTSASSDWSELLQHLMLHDPVAGYHQGPWSGPLDATEYRSFAPDPDQAVARFRREAAVAGFAARIESWRDTSGDNQVLELGFRFPQTAVAAEWAADYDRTLSSLGHRGGFGVAGAPRAEGFLIAAAAPGGTITDRIGIVVAPDGNYLVVTEADAAQVPGNHHPVPASTALRLAVEQERALPNAPGRGAATGGWWLPLVVVAAVAAVASVAAVSLRSVQHR